MTTFNLSVSIRRRSYLRLVELSDLWTFGPCRH